MSTKIGVVLIVLALAAAVALTWRQQRVAADLETIRQNVLCAQCGYEARLSGEEQRKLMPDPNKPPAIGPDFGPGLRCPKCARTSLYLKPITCRKCGTKFLQSKNRKLNSIDIKCPKCGWEG